MIVVENLNKKYNNTLVLKDINLSIKKGEVVVIKGVSGSGKSTLLSILAALDKPSSGKVLIKNEAIHKLPDIYLSQFRAKNIGIIFQNFNLIEHFTALENILASIVINEKDLSKATKKAKEALELAHISHKIDNLIKNLSGGEKQRVAIARALANKPDIIICDEPTASLDKKNSLKFLDTIKELKNMGKTIIIATHDPIFESLEVDFRELLISDGRLINNE